ncbi:MAG: Asp-tRNA(Asn)/Glu-tRNA(Gln) amidotransferase subunit GatC [Rubritalea sp.]|uniref:Asp-tRNA(Asn)/Glu-tRNA(Gln) amidotransferase subunit GatC n=1 Tax=Rubritalea sp. TaxID=2109375 RepID=UPI00324226D6
MTSDTEENYGKQLDDLLGYIDKLSEIDVEGIEPTAHASPVFDRIREDEAKLGITREAFLDNAPDTANDQLRVPKVIE